MSPQRYPANVITGLRDLFSKACATKTFLLAAIDGVGGAGKSTLAEHLRKQMTEVVILHFDDFYRPMDEKIRAGLSAFEGYEQYFDWQRLREEVLLPLRRGEPARYQRYDWALEKLVAGSELKPTGVVIVEGVYSARPELRSFFDLTIFVDTAAARQGRLRKALERGENSRFWIERWIDAEDCYLERVMPAQFVDAILNRAKMTLTVKRVRR